MNPNTQLAPVTGGALATRPLEELAGQIIKTPLELASRIRQMSQVAHILSPAIAVSSIADHYVVNTAVVVIDTTLPPVEYGTAAGNDVYYQSSIHKGKNRKNGDTWETAVEEVSLNKNGLLKILGAAGVDITSARRTDDGREPYYWAYSTQGVIVDFDGRRRQLPPGDVEIDLRDGSASIGEWTPEEWRRRVLEADREKAATKNDEARKKIKPEPINGWSEERVRNARRFGLRVAQTESMNRLARNLGLKQKYTLAELQKPFVLFRCSFNPDMSDPVVRQMVTAANLGATQLLYPQPAPIAPGVVEMRASSPANVIDADALTPDPPIPSTPKTAAPPSGAVAFDDFPEPPTSTTPRYRFVHASKAAIDGQDWFFFTAENGSTFCTEDVSAARVLNKARQDGREIAVESEPLTLAGQTYLHVLELPAAPATLKL